MRSFNRNLYHAYNHYFSIMHSRSFVEAPRVKFARDMPEACNENHEKGLMAIGMCLGFAAQEEKQRHIVKVQARKGIRPRSDSTSCQLVPKCYKQKIPFETTRKPPWSLQAFSCYPPHVYP